MAVTHSDNETISTSVLIKKLNVFSVLSCIMCSMYCLSGKEPIMEPMLQYYYGISHQSIAKIAMVEGGAFIVGSVAIASVNQKYKNFNKLCLFGVFLYFIGMGLGGPLYLFNVIRE